MIPGHRLTVLPSSEVCMCMALGLHFLSNCSIISQLILLLDRRANGVCFRSVCHLLAYLLGLVPPLALSFRSEEIQYWNTTLKYGVIIGY